MEKLLWFSMVGLGLIKKNFYLLCSVCLKKQMILKAQQYSVANTECCGVQV